MNRGVPLSYTGCGARPYETEGDDMSEPRRHWDGAGLERKILSAGRPWTVGDIAMVADGQWAVRTKTGTDEFGVEETVVERRIADAQRVELTAEELARAVGSRPVEAHRDEEAD